jgi:hypothetical protein
MENEFGRIKTSKTCVFEFFSDLTGHQNQDVSRASVKPKSNVPLENPNPEISAQSCTFLSISFMTPCGVCKFPKQNPKDMKPGHPHVKRDPRVMVGQHEALFPCLVPGCIL